MGSGPLPTDLRIQIPRRSLAAWYRVSKQFEPLLKNVGVEPNPANLLAAMLEVLDGLNNPNHIPSSNPNSPIEEWPDGTGMTIASGRIGRRLEPGESPNKDRGVPIRPAPKAGRKRKAPPTSDAA